MIIRKTRSVEAHPIECFRFIYEMAITQLRENSKVKDIEVVLPPSMELSKQLYYKERPLEFTIEVENAEAI